MGLFLAILYLSSQLTPGHRARQVQVDNFYTYRNKSFNWTVFIREEPSVLQEIRCVEYTLHPTFPKPVQRSCDSTRRFELSASGWGEFSILLKIEWKDRSVTRQSYMLDLHSPSRKRG